jgi:hypothetical protein
MSSAANSMLVRTRHQLRFRNRWTASVPIGKRSVHSAHGTVSMQEAAALGDFVQAAGSAAAGVLPGALGDIMLTLAGDAGDLVDLQPSVVGLVRLGV